MIARAFRKLRRALSIRREAERRFDSIAIRLPAVFAFGSKPRAFRLDRAAMRYLRLYRTGSPWEKKP